MAKKAELTTVIFDEIKTRRVIAHIVGTSPLIMHRFAFKAWQELLCPSPRKNAAERAQTLKHNPLEEYRGCFYRNRNPNAPALFHLPNGMPHQSIAAAALDIPGTTRAAMERWTQVVDINIDLYGVPQLFMAMVRNSDMNRTPDVRTRPIFPRWACKLEIEYKQNPLTDQNVLNLIAAAGLIVGFGDWRPQKGGPYGKYRLAEARDTEFLDIVKREARAPQQAAYDQPAYYDDDTADLMLWFTEEMARRRQDDPESPGNSFDDGIEIAPGGLQ